MNDELDDELTPDQWDALKALRSTASRYPHIDQFTIDGLVALGLVAMRDGLAVITPKGRTVLVRGSSRLLLDLAA